ncbi:MAG: hypothetical protein KME35_08040 [Aphanocapsa sp. GSE-SYN-MK-11-07L]|jgi:hypothetical protein|nr:hypothetical protein [Aphanocapsa sp. GSE-SYN-MK-11-07L]
MNQTDIQLGDAVEVRWRDSEPIQGIVEWVGGATLQIAGRYYSIHDCELVGNPLNLPTNCIHDRPFDPAIALLCPLVFNTPETLTES